MIVTIDGPAGAGKSTAARALADRLGYYFLDTGAMYRVVALKCLDEQIDLTDDATVAKSASRLDISFAGICVLADGKDVTDAIRTQQVSQAASVVAANAGVRTALAELQREFGRRENIVTEGRDQGTVVFPEADCKFFLTADARQRATRRLSQLQEKGQQSSVDQTLAEIRERDERDQNRSVAPLKPAANAIHVDTSSQTADEVLELLVQTVRKRAGLPGSVSDS